MHRKAIRTVKRQQRLKSITDTPSTPNAISLQQISTATTKMEYSNSSYFDRESVSTAASQRVPLLASKTLPQILIEESSTQDNISPANETNASASVWIRRRLTNIPLSSTTNGPLKKKPSCTPRTSIPFPSTKPIQDHSIAKHKESLYAIHIYNRLVFLMFFITVIATNVYTWFFYSRTVRSKLLDREIPWSCFDESSLAIVNCSDTS
jgi:hypothetical protein